MIIGMMPGVGIQGPPGDAATVAVGTVGVGSSPSVTNSGSSSAATLNFLLQTGATGATGPQGIPGTDAAQTQALRATTAGTGLYTWTYATPFANGVVPVIECCAEGPDPQNGVTVNAQLEGTPTNTSCKIRVTRTAATVVALIGLTILSISTSTATVIHLTARVPS